MKLSFFLVTFFSLLLRKQLENNFFVRCVWTSKQMCDMRTSPTTLPFFEVHNYNQKTTETRDEKKTIASNSKFLKVLSDFFEERNVALADFSTF